MVRSRTLQGLGIAMSVAAVIGLGAVVAEGVSAALTYAAALLLFAVLGWAAFWRPGVVVSDAGVLVINTWRGVHVPWPAVESVDGRYGLRLRTAYGVVTAWGVTAPSGRSRRGENGVSEAAVLVGQRLEDLRAAGYLDSPALERASLQRHWHLRTIVAVTTLLVLALALPALA